MNYKFFAILLTCTCFVFTFLQGCSFIDFPDASTSIGRDTIISVNISKWYNNHKGAISLTSDDSWLSEAQTEARQFMKQYGITMDYEVVTSEWEKDENTVNYFADSLITSGTGYYGHGHLHINHDAFSYDYDLADFKKCFEVMKSFGMIPVSYAYPGGFGYHISTQNALHDAGFLSARMFEKLDFADPYIIPGDQKEPPNWYTLPTLIMQSPDYNGCQVCVNNTAKLIPYLDECINKASWIILTYHALDNVSEFGYYFSSDLKNDVVAISQRDFWQSSMNRVTLYILEREKANVSVIWHRNDFNSVDTIKVNLDDNLPDSTYYQPLTINFEIPSYWLYKKINIIRNNKITESLSPNSQQIRISLLPTKSIYYFVLEK